MNQRNLFHHCFRTLTAICAIVACIILLAILSFIVYRGASAISWDFLTQKMSSGGAEGGILHNIIGTLILLITALAFCTPLALGLAIVHSVYLRFHPLRSKLSLILYLMNGVPSILFGIIGMVVFIQWLGWGKSWLSGGILLALMMLPTVTITLIERISSIPKRYIDSARGLGLPVSSVIRSVILPQSVCGLITGSLLGLARAAGETAPIMFTATIFAGASLPTGVRENPVLSLPYHIFILAQDSYDPKVKANLWASALVLVAIVAILSLIALPARLKIHEEAAHG